MNWERKLYRTSITIALILGFQNFAFGVTEHKPLKISFTKNSDRLKASLTLPVLAKESSISIPVKHLKNRSIKFSTDDRIEPVQVYIPRDSNDLEKTLQTISRPEKINEVRKFVQGKLDEKKQFKTRIMVDIPKSLLPAINLEGVSEVMSRIHYDVTLLSKKLNQDRRQRRALLSQMKFFIEKPQRVKIAAKLRKNKDLSLHEDLLPNFARKMAKRFISYRGPNCFHAALAFHNQTLTKSPAVNVKEEKGYHRAMINYDELWRAINRHFYEVDTSKSQLKYGDMIVFFNLPEENPNYVNFRWIRHTATYLFDQYTFSKGSKSPNTPYSIKTLADEWNTWRKYTKRLGVKVYRRANRVISEKPPKDLTDWIF